MSIVKDILKEFILTKNAYKHGGFWYLLRKGLAYLVYIPITKYYRRTRRGKHFLFRGEPYQYEYALYNATWRNERAVEVPIVFWSAYYFDLITGGPRILEIGNVMGHYIKAKNDVLDKYEKGENIINEDIATFKPEKKYDLIVSISTLEHVGIDETPSKPEKLIEALFNIKTNVLKPGGVMIATVPVGYNGCLDQLLTFETDLFSSVHCMWRKSHRSLDWIEVDWTPHLIKGASVDVKSGYGSTLIAILEMTNE